MRSNSEEPRNSPGSLVVEAKWDRHGRVSSRRHESEQETVAERLVQVTTGATRIHVQPRDAVRSEEEGGVAHD